MSLPNPVVRAAIHSAIGVAWVGHTLDAFFINQQSSGGALQEMTSDEVLILAEHHPRITISGQSNGRIRTSISARKIERVNHIASQWLQMPGKRPGQLSIQQDLHAVSRSTR